MDFYDGTQGRIDKWEGVVKVEKKEKNLLSVKMFGNFSLLYNGKSLNGQKTSESQFVYLMQIVLHNRKNGVSREAVEEVLFGDRDIDDPHHALRSVVYNARKNWRRPDFRNVITLLWKRECSAGTEKSL